MQQTMFIAKKISFDGRLKLLEFYISAWILASFGTAFAFSTVLAIFTLSKAGVVH